jgi:hypothetical protein
MSNRTRQFPAGSEIDLSKGEIFEVLQNQRRRYVLQYLNRFDGPVDLSDLAIQIAAWEYHTPTEEVTDDQKKRVYTTLQQTHLRKLEEAGIIKYDSDENVVSATSCTDELTVYLEIVPGSEFPWREYYLSLGAISSAIVVALWAQAYPLTLLSPLQWATVITAVFTLSAAYHTYSGADMRLDSQEFPPESEE